jgi:hypothetical protein
VRKFVVGTALLIGMGALVMSSSCVARGHIHRSHAVTHAFERSHPCPSTGLPHGSCPGYVIDHIKPLCAHGPDAISNMQWQTIADGKAKDRLERQMCAR